MLLSFVDNCIWVRQETAGTNAPSIPAATASCSLKALPAYVARSQREEGTLLVAVAMKRSRYVQLARQGLFPCTAAEGVAFFPLVEDATIALQMPFDVLLHKVGWRGVFCPHVVAPNYLGIVTL